MANPGLRFLSIHELGRHFRSGDLTPVEVTRSHLDAIQELDDHSHDYITVTADRALADAKSAEEAFLSGEDRGPLQGIPIALKDLIDTAGIPTTAGTTIWRDRVPRVDATIARRLAASGSVLLGKTNLVEFAFGPYGLNPHYGTPPNPWCADRVPGGSSCGSGGAVGRGCAVAAIGTDTGGSIRLPASFSGIVGLKPTVQRVSRSGVVPLSWTLDSVGPLTRTVSDAAIVFDAIAGYDKNDSITGDGPTFDGVADGIDEEATEMRVGIVRDPFFDDADEEVTDSVDAAAKVLETAGVDVDVFELPEARTELDAELEGRGSVSIMCVEGYACHRETLRDRGGDIDPRIKQRIEIGGTVTAADYAEAIRNQRLLGDSAVSRMQRVDALLTPTTLYPAPRISDVSKAPARLTTRIVNYLGLCAVSVPCGFSKDGLPIGLQIIGKPYDEHTVLKLARAYEHATNWHKRVPPTPE